jgi:hypothetical protein
MEIIPGVRSADDHDNKFRIFPNDLVTYRGPKGVAIVVDPAS